MRRVARAVADAVTALAASPGRLVVAAMGAALAAAAFVVATTFGAESQRAVQREFSRLDATLLVVTTSRDAAVADIFDAHVLARIERLPGVEAVGTAISLGQWPLRLDRVDAGRDVSVYAVSVGALAAASARVTPPGVVRGPLRRQTAVVGVGALRDLDVARLETLPRVRLAGVDYALVGRLERARGLPRLLDGVAVSAGCCGHGQRSARSAELLVDTDPRLTEAIAARLPALIDPEAPRRVSVSMDAAPTHLRSSVERTIEVVAGLIAAGALVVGLVVNVLLRYVAVRERRSEFGLRAALGARRSDVVLQVVAECLIVGLLGASLGVVAGVGSAAGYAATGGEVLGVDATACLVALAAGVASGIAAGIPPAWVAARIAPAVALRT